MLCSRGLALRLNRFQRAGTETEPVIAADGGGGGRRLTSYGRHDQPGGQPPATPTDADYLHRVYSNSDFTPDIAAHSNAQSVVFLTAGVSNDLPFYRIT